MTLPPGFQHPLRNEIGACTALVNVIKDKVQGRIDFRSTADQVVMIECARAINTCEAIVALVLDGYGLQGEMLVRALLEAVVTASWASHHPDETAQRYPLNQQYLLWLWATGRRECGLYDDSGAPHDLGDDQLTQAQRWFGRYGERPWIGVGLYDMTNEFVERQQDGGSSRIHLQALQHVVRPMLNWMLHSSGLNFWRILPPPTEGDPMVTLGPSDIGVRDALDMAWNLLVFCANVYEEHFAVEFGSALDVAIFDAWASFKDPVVIRGLRRNDPCLCQSGRKFKDCHDRLRRI